ncbi:BTAD domain-containing putative transcriptional regulator [Demequina sp. NBRC 110056]|uniref:AfsR/SARP family transcriptional regulator n=1 Tax=Demequina sp. NBRC 110056 TaxID=1570345 RepID=UPI000A070A78|nr:BTAD domain-containing putative transcriptional regulator [Demequina sp. NBRC 110056]
MVNAQSTGVPHAGPGVRVFGEVAVVLDGVPTGVPGSGRRALLALLVARRGSTVGLQELHDALWDDAGPPSAPKVIQTYVSQLRRMLEPERAHDGAWAVLRTTGTGYVLDLPVDAIDVHAFERDAAALGAVDDEAQWRRARDVLARWDREPYAGIDRPFARDEVARLEVVRDELRLRAFAGEAARDRRAEFVGELVAWCERDLCDERVAALAIEALWDTGARAAALRLHARVREQLADELGVDPGAALAALLEYMLRDEGGHRDGPPSKVTSVVEATPAATAGGGADGSARLPSAGLEGAARGPNGSALPVERTRLVGREGETADLRSLVERERLVVVTGAGGAGKTRLALRVAWSMSGEMPVRWVPLQGFTDGGALAAHCLRAMGGMDQISRSELEALVARLGDRESLLVLDNGEHLVGDVATLVETLLDRCPQLRTLVTSRLPLRVAREQRWRIPPLGVPVEHTWDAVIASDAGALFVERAGQVAPWLAWGDADAATIARICTRLDGMPLALELAAGRAGSLSLDDIDDGLSARFDLLAAPSRDEDPRHRTLRATTAWSFSLLTAPQRALLERVAVFAGAFRVADAQEVCAGAPLTDASIAATLGDLVDHSVLEHEGDGWYRLLETVRDFARESLADSAPAVEERHTAWICGVIERIGANHDRDTARWYRELTGRVLDSQAAFDCARAAGDVTTLLRVAGGAGWAPINAGRYALQAGWLDEALARAATSPPSVTKSRALIMAGAFAGMDHRVADALDALDQARGPFEAAGDADGALMCDYWSAGALADAGEHDAAVSRLQVALSTEAGGPATRAGLQTMLGEVLIASHVDGGAPWPAVEAAAIAAERDAARIAAEHGLEELLARAETTEAVLVALGGDVAGGHDACERQLRRWRAIGRGARLALGVVVTARIALAAERPDVARAHALEGIAACSALGWKGALGSAIEVLLVTDGERDPASAQALIGALPTVPPTHRWRFPCAIDGVAARTAAALGPGEADAARGRGALLTFAAAAQLATDVGMPADIAAGGRGASAADAWS